MDINSNHTYTAIHTHTQRERERKRERGAKGVKRFTMINIMTSIDPFEHDESCMTSI